MTWRIDLGNGLWYDNQPDVNGFSSKTIAQLEEHYKCSYVCEWNNLTHTGKPDDHTIAVFYQEVPHPQGSNWMGMFHANDQWFIINAEKSSRLPIKAYVADDGQVLFSKHRHDFRRSNDGSITVDGGREYTRLLGNVCCNTVWLLPQKGQVTIIDHSAAALLLSALPKDARYHDQDSI